jgi:hypothetical protein
MIVSEGGKEEMKKKRFFIFWIALSLIFIGLNAQGAMIDDSRYGSDTYWGGRVVNSSPTTYGDVIGYPEFSLDGMTITISGNAMTVVITGDYFKRQGLAASYGPGDLYIDKDGWSVSGTAPHYYEDTFSSSEGWDYVIHLNPGTSSTLPGSIYEIDFSKIIPTSAPSGYIYRADQAWSGGYGNPVQGNVTGSINSSSITYNFDTTYLGLGNEFGLHWTMKCGNDVIEGRDDIQTPEPATIILLGAGLVSLAGGLRRRKK